MRLSACIFVFLFALTSLPALLAEEGELSPGEIMEKVFAGLPSEVLEFSGKLSSGSLRGNFDCSYEVEIVLGFGQDPVFTSYTVFDSLGRDPERLNVVRKGKNEVDLTFCRGDPFKAVAPPNLGDTVKETEVVWGDLTWSFLWWQPTRVLKKDSYRGRNCYVIELKPPQNTFDSANSQETRRLWVDQEMFMFLQMEVYLDDKPVRRLMVRGFKKMDEESNQWTVKDIEIRSLKLSRRTLLRIDTVRAQTN